MKKIYVIHSKNEINMVKAFLDAQTKNPLLQVEIKEHKKNRSVAQNSLYWTWVTVISNEFGLLKEDVHYDLKKRILVYIYERDDEGYAAMIQAVRKVHTEGFKEDAQALADHIVKLTSTTNATTKQFTEYLQEIERDMQSKGIALPHPEDRYNIAMGIR